MADFAAEHGLGQQAGYERALAAEVLAHFAKIDPVSPLPDESGRFTPAARAGDIVVGQRNDTRDAQVVTQIDCAVPQRNPEFPVTSTLASHCDPLDGVPNGKRQLFAIGFLQSPQEIVESAQDRQRLVSTIT